MRNRIFLIILCVIFGAIAYFAVLIDFGNDSLVGKWESENYSGSIWVNSFPDDIIFYDDNTLSVDNIAGSYKTEGNELRINASYAVIVYDYKVNDDILILTSESGRSITYYKE